MMVAACGQSSPVSEDAAGNGGDGSNPSGSLVSSQNTFLSIVPPGSNGNSAGGIGAPVPGVPTLSSPKNFSDQLTMRSDERRVGKDWIGTCRSRWSPSH